MSGCVWNLTYLINRMGIIVVSLSKSYYWRFSICHGITFILSTVSWAFVLHSAFVWLISCVVLWKVAQIFYHPPGGTLTPGNHFHVDLKTKQKCVSRSFCERNCFGQWVVRRVPALITQMCTRALHCTRVLLHASHNLKCRTVMLLALRWGERPWVYFTVSFLRFLLWVMTRQN